MIAATSELKIGFACFFRGFRTLRTNRGLWKYAVVPFFLGLVVFGVLFYLSVVAALTNFAPLVMTWIPTWFPLKEIVANVVAALVLIALLLCSTFVSFVLIRIFASPFNAVLAERVLLLRGVINQNPVSMVDWLKQSGRMFVVGLSNGFMFLILGLILLLLSLVPGLNVLTAFAFVLIAAYEVTDYSFEALQMAARPRIDYFYRNIRYFSGFALALGLVFLIPGLNLLLFPVAVIGGSELVSEIAKNRR